MTHVLTPLPPLLSSPSRLSKDLPELHPLFFIPLLEDRPQNPIVEALVEVSPLSDLVHQREEVILVKSPEPHPQQVEEREEDIWTNESVVTQKHVLKNQNLSWDALRSTFPKEPTSTPFITEQSNNVFAAVRHHVQPRLNDPSLHLRYILPTELLHYLANNLVGNSSSLYIWDTKEERLVPSVTGDGKKLLVIIEGLDGVGSTSIIQRFLSIGTLMRRLEMLVLELQRRTCSPTTHAFLHALSTVLVYIRTSLTHPPPHLAPHLTSLWLHYADTEVILSTLASLCRCREGQRPPYKSLPDPPAELLSRIYKFVEQTFERSSPRTINSIFAYILTITSRDYFTRLGESLGLSESSQATWLRTGAFPKDNNRLRASSVLLLDDMELDQCSMSSSDEELGQIEMPCFISTEFAQALHAARKSLRILRAADPDHHLCSSPMIERCNWVWLSEEVERLWECRETPVRPGQQESHSSDRDTPPDIPAPLVRDYKPELEQFRLFDLEPGTHLAKRTSSSNQSNPHQFLSSFLASFPDTLPSLTPTLQHLAAVVLQPLVTRTAVLSSSLLKLYLMSLQLETHLVLLRSYMLLTLPSFKYRLVEALFSDDDEHGTMGHGIRARTSARLGIQDHRDFVDKAASHSSGHGIGLEHSLTQRDTWPPRGADLSFFLRSVIVDSLEERMDSSGDEGAEDVWRECEYRLGFALRDLPVGDGRERWLNPMSIEALDFLYLDYKPPNPVDVVITPDILSKYQRIFTFLLRLFRAETVTRIIYRSAFKSTGPVFSYAPKAQELLIRMRFQIQAFVTSFMTYVFDSAIGSNFELYMRHISKLRSAVAAVDSPGENVKHEITDVFSLQESHSQMLDRILSACLLRTAQRAAGDALRNLFEMVLQLGSLATNLRRGAVGEIEGAEELSKLYGLFQAYMSFLVKAIQAIHTKEQANNNKGTLLEHAALPRVQQLGGGLGHRSQMEDLLTRIDPTGWWRRKAEEEMKSVHSAP